MLRSAALRRVAARLRTQQQTLSLGLALPSSQQPVAVASGGDAKAAWARATHSLTLLRFDMPRLSPAMDGGRVIAWHAAEGKAVSSGELLCEISTTSLYEEGNTETVMQIESQDDGIVIRTVVTANHGGKEEAPVGTPLLFLVDAAEDDHDAIKQAKALPDSAWNAAKPLMWQAYFKAGHKVRPEGAGGGTGCS